MLPKTQNTYIRTTTRSIVAPGDAEVPKGDAEETHDWRLAAFFSHATRIVAALAFFHSRADRHP